MGRTNRLAVPLTHGPHWCPEGGLPSAVGGTDAVPGAAELGSLEKPSRQHRARENEVGWAGAGLDAPRRGTLRVRAPQFPPSGVSTDGPSRNTSQVSRTWEDRNSESNPTLPFRGSPSSREAFLFELRCAESKGRRYVWSKPGQTPFPGDVCWTGTGSVYSDVFAT